VALLARNLGVNEGTVRNRIREFSRTGFITEVRFVLNPSLKGHGAASASIDVPSESAQDELVDRLRLLEGVFLISVFHGGFLEVFFLHKDEPSLARQVELIRRLAGAETVLVGRVPFPDCKITLSRTDWAVLKAMRGNPRRTYSSVARETHLSPKTVKRRLERMIREKTMFLFPALNPAGVAGELLAAIIVESPLESKAETDRRVVAKFDEYLWVISHRLPYQPGDLTPGGYGLMLPNVAKGLEILGEVRCMPGVKTARLEMFESIHTMYEPFEWDFEAPPRGAPVGRAT